MKYLDTNILGYAIENHPKYGQSCKKILQDIQDGTLRAASSVLVLSELIGVLKKINKELIRRKIPELDIRANIDAVLSLPITWLELELFIIKRAAEHTFPAPGADYVHAATMEIHGITHIISADQDFDRAGGIKRIDPLQYKTNN